MVPALEFAQCPLPILGRRKVRGTKDFMHCFVAFFGISPSLCVHVWDEIAESLPDGAYCFHLLWGLLFLKVYGVEDTMVSLCKTMRKTYRKWVKIIVEAVCEMKYVSRYGKFNFSWIDASNLLFFYRSCGITDLMKDFLDSVSSFLLMGRISSFASQLHSIRSGIRTSSRKRR